MTEEISQAPPAAPLVPAPERRRTTEFDIVRRNFLRNKGAIIGLVIISFLVFVAVFADVLAPYDPIAQTRAFLSPPNGTHWFGTDVLGRDMLSRVIHGTRISMAVGIGAVLIALVIGMAVGLLGGYFGGRIDAAVVMLIDTFMSFPGLLLAMVIAAMFGTSLPVVMLAVGLGEFTLFARLVRSAVYAERARDYVLASRSIGAGSFFIMARHVVPNIMPSIIVLVTLSIGNAILSAAALGFLGLGAQPPIPEWGNLVNVGRDYIQMAPWLIWFPGIAIMLTVLGANLLGDGLRDALDPKLRR
ncbi:peptide/nickel transport system permease protein [Devosia enhydra]|uniref:Peptide/nickel transport system permease protein n=1 Tax=Devosia enhydra TaxID=665118 RepID=A0A1K2HZY1_9HYPH|nr:ABC transporter permease [Devosia enhydra]SFZ85583.1 peptide/nickel transport system permease protein [Devosia enhydra]